MSSLLYTPVEDISKIQEELRAGFRSGKTKNVAFRKEQLLQLAYLIQDNQQRFRDSLHADLGRPPTETDLFEIFVTLNEVRCAYDKVAKWAKQESAPFSFNWFAMSPAIRKEPKGVVLVISPFNYPIFLLLTPLVGAIAAGCAAVLKPSEQAPATAALLTELLPRYLDPTLYRIVNGGVPETTRLLELPWDHIMYTGNGRVARIVAAAAAKHLTPVSTELGGKSPVVIDPKCDLKTAAKRIFWGKVANAGQICLAPDYVLVPRTFQDKFIEALKEVHDSFFPSGPRVSDSFSRIISEQHTQRIKKLIDETQGKIVLGGEVDVAQKYIAPTIVRDVPENDSLMSEELFGPVLPIIPVEDLDDAIRIINNHDHPLALYVFSQDSKFKAKVFDNTQSGSAIANEVVIHAGADGLPVGGVGPSGTGYYSGKYGFDMFTHFRATMDSPGWLDWVLGGRYPPYTADSLNVMRKMLLPSFPARPKNSGNPINA
ncbi:NAD-aldehyde dehydrogenase [Obba rivulosa]|uniref:Aldehyde dehydrogenase n=1 Tax=Obba rivulosa TaxID=1052685 RepID=A0A8E2DL87_9APHY|nr:NAD-aldehyde dehydrogenase [Obba rivulosa]